MLLVMNIFSFNNNSSPTLTGAAFTRFLTTRYQVAFPELAELIISYGSCQFPTLGFVVERYKQIQEFVAEPFWKLKGTSFKLYASVMFCHLPLLTNISLAQEEQVASTTMFLLSLNLTSYDVFNRYKIHNTTYTILIFFAIYIFIKLLHTISELLGPSVQILSS